MLPLEQPGLSTFAKFCSMPAAWKPTVEPVCRWVHQRENWECRVEQRSHLQYCVLSCKMNLGRFSNFIDAVIWFWLSSAVPFHCCCDPVAIRHYAKVILLCDPPVHGHVVPLVAWSKIHSQLKLLFYPVFLSKASLPWLPDHLILPLWHVGILWVLLFRVAVFLPLRCWCPSLSPSQ